MKTAYDIVLKPVITEQSMECRPLSKDKRWRLVEIIEKAK